MTRSELIHIVSSHQGQLSEKNTEKIVKDIFQQMAQALAAGHRIEIRGFGCFSIRYHRARLARNPKTGEYIAKAAKYSLHFKPGKDMRNRVNQCRQH